MSWGFVRSAISRVATPVICGRASDRLGRICTNSPTAAIRARVVADWQRKSYGEENTFEHDLALDSLELRRVLIAHAEALGRRLRADQVRARTVTLKLKLARPLGGGRYPLLTRSASIDDIDRRQRGHRQARDRAARASHRIAKRCGLRASRCTTWNARTPRNWVLFDSPAGARRK